MLYNFEALGVLQVVMGQGANGHNSYIVQVTNDEAICDMWSQLSSVGIEKLPSETPYSAWTSTKHITGATMVKTGNRDILESLTPDTHSIVFDCINKAQEIGWQVNKAVYDIHTWALRNKTDAFAEIWEQSNPEARATKLREAKAIGDIAKRFLGKTFYH
jgi:DNA-directed RNA polymerase